MIKNKLDILESDISIVKYFYKSVEENLNSLIEEFDKGNLCAKEHKRLSELFYDWNMILKGE